MPCTRVTRDRSATQDRRPPGLHRRASACDAGESSCDTAAGHGLGDRCRRIGSSALRAGGPGCDVPAPRRFAARLPVKVSRAYARDGQANGLRTKSTTRDTGLRPAPRRESERTSARESQGTLRCTRRCGRNRSEEAFAICAACGLRLASRTPTGACVGSGPASIEAGESSADPRSGKPLPHRSELRSERRLELDL